MERARRWIGWLAVAAGVASLASVTARAASSYSVGVRASSPVAEGHSFSVTARGVAEQQALLYVYLDRNACGATWVRESMRVGVYESGRSYFRQDNGGPPKQSDTYAYVSGSFTKSFTAHAGTAAGREFACAYLATKNSSGGYRINAAGASARYTVTK